MSAEDWKTLQEALSYGAPATRIREGALAALARLEAQAAAMREALETCRGALVMGAEGRGYVGHGLALVVNKAAAALATDAGAALLAAHEQEKRSIREHLGDMIGREDRERREALARAEKAEAERDAAKRILGVRDAEAQKARHDRNSVGCNPGCVACRLQMLGGRHG